MSDTVTAGQGVQESVGSVFFDPRSPTVGIVRTPLKDSMKGELELVKMDIFHLFYRCCFLF